MSTTINPALRRRRIPPARKGLLSGFNRAGGVLFAGAFKPGEDLAIRSGLLAIRRTSYIVRQDVHKLGSQVLVAEASIVFVAVNREGVPVPVPESWNVMLPHWPEAE